MRNRPPRIAPHTRARRVQGHDPRPAPALARAAPPGTPAAARARIRSPGRRARVSPDRGPTAAPLPSCISACPAACSSWMRARRPGSMTMSTSDWLRQGAQLRDPRRFGSLHFSRTAARPSTARASRSGAAGPAVHRHAPLDTLARPPRRGEVFHHDAAGRRRCRQHLRQRGPVRRRHPSPARRRPRFADRCRRLAGAIRNRAANVDPSQRHYLCATSTAATAERVISGRNSPSTIAKGCPVSIAGARRAPPSSVSARAPTAATARPQRSTISAGQCGPRGPSSPTARRTR